jgi:hypothetical protein
LFESAIAYLHPKDKYDKVIGKKIALTKALAKCSSVFTKKVLKEIWVAFWEWAANWKVKQ